jgi:hypothetical protein
MRICLAVNLLAKHPNSSFQGTPLLCGNKAKCLPENGRYRNSRTVGDANEVGPLATWVDQTSERLQTLVIWVVWRGKKSETAISITQETFRSLRRSTLDPPIPVVRICITAATFEWSVKTEKAIPAIAKLELELFVSDGGEIADDDSFETARPIHAMGPVFQHPSGVLHRASCTPSIHTFPLLELRAAFPGIRVT